VIDEARRMIRMSRAAVLVFNGNTGMLESIATFGHQMTPVVLKPDVGIIGAVFSSAKAEIVNDVAADPRCMDIGLAQSLICAPLKASRGAIGVISLDSVEPIEYTAADLKLLTALAAQAAPPIEQALHYEGKLKEAREREELLRRQLQDLRIELDQGRKARQVAEITDTDYFQQLQARARELRSQAAR
jgi:adenylate cyclase